MMSLGLSLTPLSLKPSLRHPPLSFSSSIPCFKLLHHPHRNPRKKKFKRGVCKADFYQDAPFAAAIGACVLSSLVLPTPKRADEDEDSAMTSTDARLAVMGIVSFIPYFNWLSWVFAWLDTGKRRYGVYSLVYLIPYLRYNLSISPEDSWLPIASIALCIIHIQLEASIQNGDLQGFQLFTKASKHISSTTSEKENHSSKHVPTFNGKEKEEEQMNLPSGDDQSRDGIRRWGVPKKHEQLNGDWSDEERRNQ